MINCGLSVSVGCTETTDGDSGQIQLMHMKVKMPRLLTEDHKYSICGQAGSLEPWTFFPNIVSQFCGLGVYFASKKKNIAKKKEHSTSKEVNLFATKITYSIPTEEIVHIMLQINKRSQNKETDARRLCHQILQLISFKICHMLCSQTMMYCSHHPTKKNTNNNNNKLTL